MGGSGPKSWTPTSPRDPCASLKFRSAINSPQPAVGRLKVGDVLRVTLQTTPYTAVVVMRRNRVVGALTGVNVNRLISCIQTGFKFEAKVISITGADCVVDVQPE
jgi:hypothetical protein